MDQLKLAGELHAVIDRTKLIRLILTIARPAIGLGLALLIGRAISCPMVGMTHAMTTIAGGNNAVVVPGTGRKDEIGEMASSNDVFKQNGIERQRLEQVSKSEQAAREKRQATADGLIKNFDSSVAAILPSVGNATTQMTSTASVRSTPPWRPSTNSMDLPTNS